MDHLAPVDRSNPIHVDNLLRMTQPADDGCLIWTGGTCAAGLPLFNRNNAAFRVARRIYLVCNGPLSKPTHVIEPKCSNLRCIAPEHLHEVPHSRATRRLIGVPLPKGESLKSAGYELVHRKRGASIWEPKDIAIAVWTVQGVRCCVVCGIYIERRAKRICSRACERVREAAKRRRSAGRPLPGDERFHLGTGQASREAL